ncbi:MAG: glycosyltransferase family 2 protein [Snowella sp.]|nr:glycosyltransferase family 2 protein [Snowella sp.]
MKLISVIVPVYNVEAYIQETIRSVLAQTYPHFELIIVDDGSPDRSIELCQQFTDERIRIIHQKNRGLAGARNTGIRHAKGEYLAFLDSDDLWLPEKLEKHFQHLENSPEVGLSFSRSAFIDANGNSLGIYQMPKLTNIPPSHLLCRNPIGNGSAPVIRRETLEAIRFQENRYGTVEDFYFDDSFRRSEDIECWIRIAVQTPWKIEGIPEALTLYRVNEEGLSANVMQQYESWEAIIQKTRSYAPELVAKWENPARAYQLRYLARRAVRFKSGKTAVELVNRALATHWQIILAEPSRTLLTLGAAYFLYLMPLPLYNQIEALALKITGYLQKLKVSRQIKSAKNGN